MSTDLTVETFLALRETFFGADGRPKPFALRDKRNTQDDPLDEYITQLLKTNLADAMCQKAPGPNTSPDFVVYRPDECNGIPRSILREDLSRIVAVEVKKIERTSSGQVARSTGMDYNTTPPCGTVRVYDADDQHLDIRGFYLFVCLEREERGQVAITALSLCDGNLLNADFGLYLQITGQRTKGLGLGTYGDGMNRNRPMLVFSNPLGALQLDRTSTLVTDIDLTQADERLELAYEIGRTIPEGGERLFYAYKKSGDLVPDWEIQRLVDPFPRPRSRVVATQARGKFRLPIYPADIEENNTQSLQEA